MKMKRLTIADLKRAAAQYGATLDIHDQVRYTNINVDAPAGKLWSCTGDIHALNLGWNVEANGSPTWPEEKQGALIDAIERMTYGLVDCDNPDCDVCHPEPESAEQEIPR